MNDKKIQIRNSTVDFLVFTKDAAEDSIEVRVQDKDGSRKRQLPNCLM